MAIFENKKNLQKNYITIDKMNLIYYNIGRVKEREIYMEELLRKLELISDTRIKVAVSRLKEAEERGNHCKATINVYEYYSSNLINNIDNYLRLNKVNFEKDESNKLWVEYKLELQKD